MITPATESDISTIREQLGRVPRGVVGIAARSTDGTPLVVATAPRLPDGQPFPTVFYLSHPEYVAEASRLEAAGVMAEWTAELAGDPELSAAYAAAHTDYLTRRAQVGHDNGIDEVVEIQDFSAGGMPTRVKCLHALVGHALAAGSGVNPIGDRALSLMSGVPPVAPVVSDGTEAGVHQASETSAAADAAEVADRSGGADLSGAADRSGGAS